MLDREPSLICLLRHNTWSARVSGERRSSPRVVLRKKRTTASGLDHVQMLRRMQMYKYWEFCRQAQIKEGKGYEKHNLQ